MKEACKPNFSNYRYIIFDFDGVVAETNQVRIDGFQTLFSSYPTHFLDDLLAFVRLNGGMSRYLKIRYFFEKILQRQIGEAEIGELAGQYSDIVKDKVINAVSVKGALLLIESCLKKHHLAIISGSDQEELREVCEARGIAKYFDLILGSPTTKEDNFRLLFHSFDCGPSDCIYIGDSIGDYRAANNVAVDFIARRSGIEDWGELADIYVVDDLEQLVESV